MQASVDRILTSHTGSLPRPDDLVELLYQHDAGQLADRALLDQRVCEAVGRRRAPGVAATMESRQLNPPGGLAPILCLCRPSAPQSGSV